MGSFLVIPVDFETHDLKNLGFLMQFISGSGETSIATISSLLNGPMGAKRGRFHRVR